VGILGDVSALVDGGRLSPAVALELVPKLAREDDRHVLSSAVSIASSVRDHVVPDELVPNHARFLRRVFGARARSLGFRARRGEDEETRLLRPRIVGLVGRDGEDPVIVAEAGKLARRWLDDHSVLDAEMVDTALTIAARNGDRALFERLRAEAFESRDRRQRRRMLSALGSFRDRELARSALTLVLDEELDVREAASVSFGVLRERTTRDLAFDYYLQNYDAIVARLPRDGGARVIRMGSSFCDADHRSRLLAFFSGRASEITGGPRALEQALESMDLCMVAVAAQRPDVVRFLQRY
jgi:alanyl aminopeptidase